MEGAVPVGITATRWWCWRGTLEGIRGEDGEVPVYLRCTSGISPVNSHGCFGTPTLSPPTFPRVRARGDVRPTPLKLSIGMSEYRFSDVALEPVRAPGRSFFPSHLTIGPDGNRGASK